MRLASTFGRGSHQLYSPSPLSDDEIRAVAPSIFAEDKHQSRSDRYSYIPTSQVLTGLRDAGFQPFMVGQTRVRDEGKRDHTKHIIRLRHADQIAGKEANEIILLNSHDGTSSYQLLAGQFRFVCMNGMVCGETYGDQRFNHKGKNLVDDVIDGCIRVLDDFEAIAGSREQMKAITLDREEQRLLAKASIDMKFDVSELKPAPVTADDALSVRRPEDRKDDLWTVFNRLQENLIQRGGLRSRTATGRNSTTRPVVGIDQNVKLNRALWTLAEGMAKLKT